MKTNTVIKRISALALTFIMALSLVVPAMASGSEVSDTYTITIDASENKFISKPTGSSDDLAHRYQALPILTVKGQEDESISLSFEWGGAVKEESALCGALSDILGEVDVAADSVAEAINKAADSVEAIQKVANTVAAKDDEGEYRYLDSTKNTSSSWESEVWTISIPKAEAGYYLVRDSQGAGSEVIVALFKDITITPKAIAGPTADKSIVVDAEEGEEGGNTTKAKAFEIGETIKYRLTGTLPENYADYDTYQFIFIDTMSKGLTFDEGSVTVYALHDEKVVQRNISGYELTSNPDGEKTVVKIKFDNLNDALAEDVKATAICVEYTAKLNENAETSWGGNTNSFKLKYGGSNGDTKPGEDDLDETTPPGGGDDDGGGATAYTFGIKIEKVNAANGESLEGAKFVLERVDGESESEGESGNYAILKGSAGVYCLTTEETEDTVTTMDTTDDGILNIKGLSAGTYRLREVEAPDGFELLDEDITITFTPEYNADGTSLESVTYTTSLTEEDTIRRGEDPDLVVGLPVPNWPTGYIPGTGGMGVYLFYISGSVLLLGAALYLICSNVKNKKKSVSDT